MELDPAELDRVQRVFARCLDIGTKIGFALLVGAFAAYVSGLLPPQVPFADLPGLWGQPVGRYLDMTGAPTGWGWIRLLGTGDYLNLAVIALFPSVSIVCYLRILPALLAQGDRLYALIAALQIAVLLAAASGLLH